MPLDPQAQAYLDQRAALNAPPLQHLTPTVVRQGMRAQLALLGEPAAVARSEDRTIPGPDGAIPIRLYWPDGSGPFPILVFFHGGGWVIGDLETHDALCRNLTNGAGCLVVSVDYRLAPEAKFPAAPHDCYAATVWVAAHAAELQGTATRIAVGGDSAGGNLAAVVAHMARDAGGPPLVFQLLIYPATDFTAENASRSDNAQGYGLGSADMEWFGGHYLNHPAEGTHPLASPHLAADVQELPPALVITAEFDPLRDEGEAYGRRLQAAGVSVTISHYPGMIHGFLSLDTLLDQGRAGIAESCAALRAAFGA